ncbi:hypothetical protein ACOWPH_00940 [Anabaena sp. PCC 7938]|uniref:Uncharacterized protein n=1 Tax=Anabaena cylindrica (strain ATCC 27899 / PCC 7122) TaxID=272123 RepID=K9ZCJ8_ANACC|nr:hypothetical protein [Anabaena sp. CCAP 1446/1C]AFZ56901.1 hypothetical protein Anacy_1390 [Anabaena cylindrica PCC 7122]MBY5284888.1 hypothetical protein [Anabaena sp. CCAP 1446/1C]MCM2409386.1 hypothetical protein [Anabaena sp. CCAP 1446/1C]BAY06142.1 hypothetical protein NIES19_54250 [Anabaena cylindrica PCC 7122]
MAVVESTGTYDKCECSLTLNERVVTLKITCSLFETALEIFKSLNNQIGSLNENQKND